MISESGNLRIIIIIGVDGNNAAVRIKSADNVFILVGVGSQNLLFLLYQLRYIVTPATVIANADNRNIIQVIAILLILIHIIPDCGFCGTSLYAESSDLVRVSADEVLNILIADTSQCHLRERTGHIPGIILYLIIVAVIFQDILQLGRVADRLIRIVRIKTVSADTDSRRDCLRCRSRCLGRCGCRCLRHNRSRSYSLGRCGRRRGCHHSFLLRLRLCLRVQLILRILHLVNLQPDKRSHPGN